MAYYRITLAGGLYLKEALAVKHKETRLAPLDNFLEYKAYSNIRV